MPALWPAAANKWFHRQENNTLFHPISPEPLAGQRSDDLIPVTSVYIRFDDD